MLSILEKLVVKYSGNKDTLQRKISRGLYDGGAYLMMLILWVVGCCEGVMYLLSPGASS